MSQTESLTAEQQNLLTEAAALTSNANTLWQKGQYAETEKLYRQALALQEQVWGADHPHTASALYNLGNLYFVQENTRRRRRLTSRP